jgi:hypothetical protein
VGSEGAVTAGWSRRRWFAAAGSGVLIALLVALPTAVIPNPVFGRAVAVTWWSYPVVILMGVLGGLLFATYVRESTVGADAPPDEEMDRASTFGMAGTLVSFFAVGCPVCNKLVLVALGTTGAVTWFAPVQPFLALASIVLMTVALRIRIRNQKSCRVPA